MNFIKIYSLRLFFFGLAFLVWHSLFFVFSSRQYSPVYTKWNQAERFETKPIQLNWLELIPERFVILHEPFSEVDYSVSQLKFSELTPDEQQNLREFLEYFRKLRREDFKDPNRELYGLRSFISFRGIAAFMQVMHRMILDKAKDNTWYAIQDSLDYYRFVQAALALYPAKDQSFIEFIWYSVCLRQKKDTLELLTKILKEGSLTDEQRNSLKEDLIFILDKDWDQEELNINILKSQDHLVLASIHELMQSETRDVPHFLASTWKAYLNREVYAFCTLHSSKLWSWSMEAITNEDREADFDRNSEYVEKVAPSEGFSSKIPYLKMAMGLVWPPLIKEGFGDFIKWKVFRLSTPMFSMLPRKYLEKKEVEAQLLGSL